MNFPLLIHSLMLCLIWSSTAEANNPMVKTEKDTDNSNKTCKFSFQTDSTMITMMWMTFVLIFLSIFRMAYHFCETLAEYVPESCLLIVIGFILGLTLKYMKVSIIHDHILQPDTFFFILLPPIMLNAAYSLHNRTFAENLSIVLTFAVLGTILNFIIIGSLLYPLYLANIISSQPNHYELNLMTFFLFSSLIVAVDPVAVLAIFQEIGVNERLYYMVFGESLLNDAVTVVLYNIVKELYPLKVISSMNIVNGFFSFFTISLGGLSVGILVGIWSCFLVRFTTNCRMIEPAVIMVTGYFSYILGDLFGWSGIISIIGCGLLQIAYAFENMSNRSVAMVQELISLLSWNAEAIIFLLLGVEVTGYKTWINGFGFVASSLMLCLFARTVVVLFICWFVQVKDGKFSKIKFTEQFVIIYGGMRGGISFTLAVLLRDIIKNRYLHRLLLDTTIVVVLFTVFIMGISMKPLVAFLKIKIENPEKMSLLKELNNFAMDNLLLGMEYITGEKGMFVLRNFLSRVDKKYIRKILLKNPDRGPDNKFIETYKTISLALHKANLNPDKKDLYLKDMHCPVMLTTPPMFQLTTSDRDLGHFNDRKSLYGGNLRAPPLKALSRCESSQVKSFAIHRKQSINPINLNRFKENDSDPTHTETGESEIFDKMHKILKHSLHMHEDTSGHYNTFKDKLSIMVQRKSILAGAADAILDDLASEDDFEIDTSSNVL